MSKIAYNIENESIKPKNVTKTLQYEKRNKTCSRLIFSTFIYTCSTIYCWLDLSILSTQVMILFIYFLISIRLPTYVLVFILVFFSVFKMTLDLILVSSLNNNINQSNKQSIINPLRSGDFILLQWSSQTHLLTLKKKKMSFWLPFQDKSNYLRRNFGYLGDDLFKWIMLVLGYKMCVS